MRGDRFVAIFVRSMGVGIGCPSNRYAGQIGVVSGTLRGEIENDGDTEVAVGYSIELTDSDGNSDVKSEYIYVPASSRANVSFESFLQATYSQAGSKSATCRGIIHSDSSSTSCTFTVYAAETMPEVLRRAYKQLY
jgi:hypothetical protein